MEPSDRLALPIGHLLGSICLDDTPESAVYHVRLGWQDIRLTVPEFMVWSLAHGLPDRLDQPWTARTLLDEAADAGAGDLSAVLSDLVDRGLVALVAPGTDEVREFASTHRVFPLVLGLGNTAEEPATFRIGTTESVLAAASLPAFVLWSRSYLDEHLYAACTALAAELAEHEPGADAVTLVDGFVRMLHQLVSVNGAYLDIVTPARTEAAA